MDSWAPLFSKIVESSIWDEDDLICKVWITLLALKDADHVVRKNLYQIARAARKTQEDVSRALKVLAGPDNRRPGQEHDGARIQLVEDGWLVLNGQVYQDMMRRISRQVYQARWARDKRRKLRDERLAAERNTKDVEDQVERGTIGAL